MSRCPLFLSFSLSLSLLSCVVCVRPTRCFQETVLSFSGNFSKLGSAELRVGCVCDMLVADTKVTMIPIWLPR